MPMPHRIQMQLISRRLSGKEGADRLRELRAILKELPDFKNGPYADIRKRVTAEIEATHARSRVVHRDSIAIRREGAAQIALVGPPNVGKSSLIQALSEVQVRIGDYAFTTLRPVPALTRIGGVLVQFVEIPGLLSGAAEGRGGGRALLGVLRGADTIVYCQDATRPPVELAGVMAEVGAAGIELPALVAVTKMDEADDSALDQFRVAAAGLVVVGVSILDDASLSAFKEAAWTLTGLIRVYVGHGGQAEAEPLALKAGSTTLDVAAEIHKELVVHFKGARIWGPSARFAGQRVGPEHTVAEGDLVEVLVQ